MDIVKIKCKSETKISNTKTGKIYKDEKEATEADYKDIRRDVKVIVPVGLDVLGKKPLK